jgi:putative aminopeptidase FrvX
LLEETAKRKKIPFQSLPAAGLLGNDANAIQVSRSGVAAGSLGIPNRYMHTQVETVALNDLENSSDLLAHFAAAITKKTSFIPT